MTDFVEHYAPAHGMTYSLTNGEQEVVFQCFLPDSIQGRVEQYRYLMRTASEQGKVLAVDYFNLRSISLQQQLR